MSEYVKIARVFSNKDKYSVFLDDLKPVAVDVCRIYETIQTHTIDRMVKATYICKEVGIASRKFIFVLWPSEEIITLPSDEYDIHVREISEEERRPFLRTGKAGGWSPSF